ncbi:MAG: divalent-cation tolerance protein CutA [Candidatus Diapherotrites archaeon]|uniref:Divalent-cation tolerance protein CutA n=1 Tax=Candidatus Iainarchaeum sp. TaxID=3101447 RepID=A0A7J4KS74_9ARCH|nr:MAG: periplasmic divalent cation tolerance protein [archaeon GW2011_AR21]MBS3058380.1 divalent-cation tolerance protein CutA [Candidatus Diapherotrites archaeon]HIH21994.1 divalent-cation tolerance protein CutA [Candidatus Diapherotrites archaeon]HIH32843.1 divalent-cation tolerance protein CutA [Candidatus Diapherotrites archaeon]
MQLAYIACRNSKEAEKIAKALLSKKLIACANILPSTSLYFWKGRLKKTKESILIAKTTAGNFAALEKTVKALHSYELPLIAQLNVKSVNKEFKKWLEKQVK